MSLEKIKQTMHMLTKDCIPVLFMGAYNIVKDIK